MTDENALALEVIELESLVYRHLGADRLAVGERLQSLWSGYGEIRRIELPGHSPPTAILKVIRPDLAPGEHPRGWHTNASHQRKLRSYQVERHWYRHQGSNVPAACRIAQHYGSESDGDKTVLLLEDLDSTYPGRAQQLSVARCMPVLEWLAAFHAHFLLSSSDGLWPIGSYWHLGTRQEEFRNMPAGPVKQHAAAFDMALNTAHFQTLVHGDAKVANFCFSPDGRSVAAVDFQYVGSGVGIKDVVYFLGSCLTEAQCRTHETELLDRYFMALSRCLRQGVDARLAVDVEAEWRSLFAIAWTDYQRFLMGWMPGHTRINAYTRALAERAVASLPRAV